jgi:hypothetical protein
MEQNEQKDIDKVKKENILTIFFNFIFRKKPWVGTIAVFFITIIANAIAEKSGSSISLFRLLIITFFVTLTIFVCLSPVLIIHLVKSLRRVIGDEENAEKNAKLYDDLRGAANSLKLSTEKLDESIKKNEYYLEKVIRPHFDDCPRIENLVRRSHLINDVDEYYQHLKKARENADEKDVFLTNFLTKPYVIDNKYREEYYSTNIDFVKYAKCNVYRIVTVHSQEKLKFLKKLVEEAKESNSVKYNLAYLDIEKFSDETGDTLPGIVGMDIIEDKVIFMDFRYARALRKNDRFESPLYIESEGIADICRKYYGMVWNEIIDETSVSRNRHKGYLLYNGSTRTVHKDIDKIWKEIEDKIQVKN